MLCHITIPVLDRKDWKRLDEHQGPEFFEDSLRRLAAMNYSSIDRPLREKIIFKIFEFLYSIKIVKTYIVCDMNSALDNGIFYTQVFSWRIFDLSIFQVGH